MPDLHTELRSYVESTIERIDADDVLAELKVTDDGLRSLAPRRVKPAIKPAWAAVGAFAITMVVFGGLAAFVKLAPDLATDVHAGAAEIVESNGGTLGIWIVAALVAALVAGGTVWFVRRRNGKHSGNPGVGPEQGKVSVMDTLERTEEETAAETVDHRNRWLMILVVVLSVALIASVLWMTMQMRPNSPHAAPPEVVEVMDEWIAAMNAHDVDAIATVVTDDYSHDGLSLEALAGYELRIMQTLDWHVDTDDLVWYAVPSDTPGDWYVTNEGATFTARDGDTWHAVGMWEIVETEDGHRISKFTEFTD